MRANLKARGYSGIDNAEPNLYDDNIVAVVEHFQRRNGLETDGVAGPKTIAAMNVTADERVRQIIVNMERWRWLPEQLGSRYVFVNQAGFEMFLVDKGRSSTATRSSSASRSTRRRCSPTRSPMPSSTRPGR